MKRSPLFVANWKMHKTHQETAHFLQSFAPKRGDVWIAPPFTSLETALRCAKSVKIGAQNMHFEEKGAFTGEISPSMLKALGVHFVILGHSERRHVFKETNTEIAKKVKAALKFGLEPIVCVGETLQERESGKMHAVLKEQIEKSLERVSSSKIILAYEPVWAIGTGKVATPEMAQEAHQICFDLLKQHFQDVTLLYGGSVKKDNIQGLLQKPLIHGVLVGGASLNWIEWAELIQEGLS